MSESTLHLKDEATGLCVVCGANLRRPASRWWLANCWTADPKHYRASQTCHPAETVRPCGMLASTKTPNARLTGPQRPAQE